MSIEGAVGMIRPGEEITSDEISRRAEEWGVNSVFAAKQGVKGERSEADVQTDEGRSDVQGPDEVQRSSGNREAGSRQEGEDEPYDPYDPGLKTSYFSSRLWAGLENVVAISRGKPKWYQGKSYDALAPPWNLVHEHDEETFRRKYKRQVLDKLDPVQVVYELGDGAVMLCWEAPGEFCHRRVVAEWLEESLGIKIPELGVASLPKEPKIMTLDSFV